MARVVAIMAFLALLMGCGSSATHPPTDYGSGEGSVTVVIPPNGPPDSRYVPQAADTVAVEAATSVAGSPVAGPAYAPWDPENGAVVRLNGIGVGRRYFRGRALQGGSSGTVLARGIVYAVVLGGVNTDVKLTLVWGDLLYASDATGNFDIYLANADMSGTPVNLTNTPAAERSPSASPMGNTIVYLSYATGQPDVWKMNRDGSGKTQLTNTPTKAEHEPSVSPDFRTIAYQNWVYLVPPTDAWVRAIGLMNPDGSNQRSFVIDRYDNAPLLWSPDSTMLCTSVWNGASASYDVTFLDADDCSVVKTLAKSDLQIPLHWTRSGMILLSNHDAVGHVTYQKSAYPGLSAPILLLDPVADAYPVNQYCLAPAPGADDLYVTYCDASGNDELYYVQPESLTSQRLDWPYTRLTNSSATEWDPTFLPKNLGDTTWSQDVPAQRG